MAINSDPQVERLATLKEIPPLLPRFLTRRRLGTPVVATLLSELGLDRQAFFLLPQFYHAAASYCGWRLTPANMHDYFPYHASDSFAPHVPLLKGRGLIDRDEAGVLRLTQRGREVVRRLDAEAKAYVSRHNALPDGEEAQRLAYQLERAAQALVDAPMLPPGPGSHMATSRALAEVGDPTPALVRVEQAVYELWMARDDAHVEAWRNAGMEGPPMAVLTLLWRSEASTINDLSAMLAAQQTTADIESSLAYLFEKEYVTRSSGSLHLTPEGVLVREDIERETDRIYFGPWPYTTSEAAWVRDRLLAVIEKLPLPA